MALDNTNLLLSLAILQSQGVEKSKMVAASFGAAMIPGMMGLALPLIVARNAAANGSGNAEPAGGTAIDAVGVPVQTTVPDVVGMTELEAVSTIRKAGLNPVVSRAYFSASGDTRVSIPVKGTVAIQAPEAEFEWVDTGSDVEIEISLGPVPVEMDDTALDQDIQKKVTDLGAKVDQLLAMASSASSASSGGKSGAMAGNSDGNVGSISGGSTASAKK